MSDALQAEGYDVDAAENGAEALRYLALRRPDVIVLDLMMPVVDGWVFIESYRKVAGATIPIVSVSAGMNPHILQQLEQLGVRMTLAKPFDIQLLLERVEEALQTRAYLGA